jgi:hypothetical protein
MHEWEILKGARLSPRESIPRVAWVIESIPGWARGHAAGHFESWGKDAVPVCAVAIRDRWFDGRETSELLSSLARLGPDAAEASGRSWSSSKTVRS